MPDHKRSAVFSQEKNSFLILVLCIKLPEIAFSSTKIETSRNKFLSFHTS